MNIINILIDNIRLFKKYVAKVRLTNIQTNSRKNIKTNKSFDIQPLYKLSFTNFELQKVTLHSSSKETPPPLQTLYIAM